MIPTGAFSYYHATTKLLDAILNSPSEPSKPKIHVHVFKDSFTCIVVKTINYNCAIPIATKHLKILYIISFFAMNN